MAAARRTTRKTSEAETPATESPARAKRSWSDEQKKEWSDAVNAIMVSDERRGRSLNAVIKEYIESLSPEDRVAPNQLRGWYYKFHESPSPGRSSSFAPPRMSMAARRQHTASNDDNSTEMLRLQNEYYRSLLAMHNIKP